MFRIFPQKSYPSLWTSRSKTERKKERKKEKTDRRCTCRKTTARSFSRLARCRFLTTSPSSKSSERERNTKSSIRISTHQRWVRYDGRVWWSDALSAATRVFSSRTLARDEARARPLFLSLFGSRFLSLSPSLLSLTFTLTRTYSQFSNSQNNHMI